jgi:hypothetical protein
MLHGRGQAGVAARALRQHGQRFLRAAKPVQRCSALILLRRPDMAQTVEADQCVAKCLPAQQKICHPLADIAGQGSIGGMVKGKALQKG